MILTDSVVAFVGNMKSMLQSLIRRYVPQIARIPRDDLGAYLEGLTYSPYHPPA